MIKTKFREKVLNDIYILGKLSSANLKTLANYFDVLEEEADDNYENMAQNVESDRIKAGITQDEVADEFDRGYKAGLKLPGRKVRDD